MRAVLEIEHKDLNSKLIDVLNLLFNKDIEEIIIRKNNINLEEFDKSFKIDEIIYSLNDSGHNSFLLNDIVEGFKNSSIFSKDEN